MPGAARYGWPTPGQLKQHLRRVALLNDLRAQEKKRRSIADRRGVSLVHTGVGAATVMIEGPELMGALIYQAIQQRADAMAGLPGDTRSREQREYDAAAELLTVDADLPEGGGVSARPTTGVDGHQVALVVRGAHVAVDVPYSLTEGHELELAEVPGLGPVLPSAARELVEHADTVRRVAVDASTGVVLAVDDAVPGPHRRPRAVAEGSTPDDAGEPASVTLSAGTAALLRTVVSQAVVQRDLGTSDYRVPGRLRRFVEHRDRTCRFPGCTVPGRYCDVDHREPWPRGSTDADNCHALCRRHHRAKQLYFASVTLDPASGDTLWTTFEGTTYRSPPHRY